MNTWKIVPTTMIDTTIGERICVSSVEALEPGQHDNSPIRNELTCVVVTLRTGVVRYFGTSNAKIGPDLRMHMVINPRDYVRSKWEDSKMPQWVPALAREK